MPERLLLAREFDRMRVLPARALLPYIQHIPGSVSERDVLARGRDRVLDVPVWLHGHLEQDKVLRVSGRELLCVFPFLHRA